MSKKNIFNIYNILFWVLLAFIILIGTPVFNSLFKSTDTLKQWLNRFNKTEIVKKENEIKFDKKNAITIKWQWVDFSNKTQLVSFSIMKQEVDKARNYRINYSSNHIISERSIYLDFVEISKPVIDSFAAALSAGIQTNQYTENIDKLNYVVSAIQSPPYTKITDINECPCYDMGQNWVSDCSPRKDGKGCCNNVIPIGAYTPTEFTYLKTGDCDTKALLAYGILKKMGYDVAVIVGDADGGPHAMLAVANVRPVIFSKYVKLGSKIYYPWEVTSRNNNSVLGNTSMWNSWKNWSVIIN